MEIFKYLKDGVLIVTKNSFKEQILLNLKKMYRLKFMTMKQLIENLTFSYDEQAIYYLMKTHNYNYDVAKVYMENIYYIENIDDNNMNELQKIKNELETHNLLKQNKYFQNYLKETNIIIYNYDLNRYEQKQIEKLKELTNVLILNDEIEDKKHTIYEFPTIEEEITFVATKVVELVKNNISLSSIKLVNIDDTYFNPINRIFDFFNLDVDLNNVTLYSNLEISSFLKKLKETKATLEASEKKIANEKTKLKSSEKLAEEKFKKAEEELYQRENQIEEAKLELKENKAKLKTELNKAKKELQEAEEKISWSMPTFKGKKNVIQFAAFKKHVSIFPGPEAVEFFQDRLREYKTSKGTIQFLLAKPVPYELIHDIAVWCWEKRN